MLFGMPRLPNQLEPAFIGRCLRPKLFAPFLDAPWAGTAWNGRDSV